MAQQTVINNPPKEYFTYRRKQKILAGFQYTFAIIFTLIMIFPMYWMIISSLKTTEELLLSQPTFWPQNLYFDSYRLVFEKFPMGAFMVNSLIVTVACCLIQLVTGVLAAYAFSKGDFWGKEAIFTLILGALMVPIQVTFIPTYLMVSRGGMINTFAGLILPECVSAYFIFMLRQNFKAVDESYLDAARVDGMGRLGIIKNVLVPMNKPTIVTVTVISLINGWNSYFWPKMVTTNNTRRTVSIALREILQSYAGNEIMNYNQIMAASLICIVPITVLFLLCQKYILTGFSKSAMK